MRTRDAETPTIGVVITCFEQEEQVAEAVRSARSQSRAPAAIVVVDDGSAGEATRDALDRLPSGVTVVRQSNGGVAAARNRGVRELDTTYVAVLDGDDLWEPAFLERTTALLEADDRCVAASSRLAMFGIATHVVAPDGGALVDFLHRNACPASAVFRRSDWLRVGGYRETMRSGFEDWDFFLGLLESGGRIDIVPEPLLRYRTHPASLNVTSMTSRLERLREIVANHREAYGANLVDVLLALEATSIERLDRWERLLSEHPELPVPDPAFGDGGMAAAVRIASARAGR